MNPSRLFILRPVATSLLMIAFVLVVMNTVADLAYAALDPRVSVGARK